MSLVGRPAPDIELEGVLADEVRVFTLAELSGRWVLLVFFPHAFTGLCGSEVAAFAALAPRLAELDCALLAISVDSRHALRAWAAAGTEVGGLGGGCAMPLLADITKSTCRDYGVLDEREGVALRATFLVDPDGTVVHASANARPVGRSTVEALRLLQAFRHTRGNPEARCRADWQPADPA